MVRGHHLKRLRPPSPPPERTVPKTLRGRVKPTATAARKHKALRAINTFYSHKRADQSGHLSSRESVQATVHRPVLPTSKASVVVTATMLFLFKANTKGAAFGHALLLWCPLLRL